MHANAAAVPMSGSRAYTAANDRYIRPMKSSNESSATIIRAEMQTCCRCCYGTFVLGEDCLIILGVSWGYLVLDESWHRYLSQAEKLLPEVLVWAIIEESKGPASGSGVVYYLCDKALILTEIKLIAYSYFSGRVYNHVPEMLLSAELPEEEYHDVGTGFLFLAVQPGRKDFRVIENESVSLSEIVDDVFEDSVLYFTCVFVNYHQFAFVTPRRWVFC